MAQTAERTRNRRSQANQLSAVPRARTDVIEAVTDVRELPATDRNVMRTYMQEISKTPLLSKEEEVELAARIQSGDKAARDHMISANLRLVVKIAYDYNNFGLPLLDLISEGNIGLIKAVERFDPSKGGKLSTYAAWWIKQSIKRALANQSKTIRLPVHLVDRIAKMRKITAELADELDREPTDEEIGYAMDMPVNKVAHLKSVSIRPASLDAPVGEDGETTFGELVGDDNEASPLENLQEKSMSHDIKSVIDRLEEREAEIIQLRFGLDGNRPLTLEEVGERFDVTRERVRQIQNIAIHKMRRLMTENERQRSKEEVQEERIEQEKMKVLQEFFEEQVAS
ncbi:sigma-70 family RNA polymerase sigma factor [Coraliomargarita sp. SDUM461004]|uniref:RNA polymerase sigma factor n=2 Tax=Thalassobacterium sedimentorum TaxID=3041258 RepID=A0ABU1AI23_9BACT|nr:sigma-70 family RNA polymerase sigma factor [Coraliomargarita sp. SDUM461004]MDQ8193525.1 sigma-70 family RNA polymerase sigma factor [Coraliomargarita sp. SDUM461004]